MKELVARYLSKSKEPALSLLLAGGVWLVNEVKHAVSDVSAQITKLDTRLTAIERSIGGHVAAK